jgi:hypothetical protein
MKTYIVQLVALLFTFNSLFAQDTLKQENALLWEITGKDLKEPSYIFGTIHMIPEADYFFPEVWKEKFLACKTLALEIDINMSLMDQVALAQKIMLPHGKSLADYMDSTEYRDFQTYILDSLHIKKAKWNQMNKIKPLFSMSLIYEDLIPNLKTYETELNDMAKKNGIPTIGLETADYQIDILNKISIKDQIDMLTGDELAGNPVDELDKLIQVYKAQDINQMLLLYKEDEAMKAYEYDLLTKRNQNWIPKIIAAAKKGSTFVAVGAMHLPGDDGVLRLLESEGYTVKAIVNF